MKICKDCGLTKEYSDFVPKASCKDGYEPRCRVCRSIKYNKSTIPLVTKKIYASQCLHSTQRGHALPNYTLAELLDWVNDQPNIHALMENWKNNNYDPNLAPSIDRLDDSKSYELSNIQLMTWRENANKGAKSKMAGTVNANQRPVMSLSMDGMPQKTYHSIMDAVRDVNGHMWGIVSVANGQPITQANGKTYIPKSYKGLKWKWV